MKNEMKPVNGFDVVKQFQRHLISNWVNDGLMNINQLSEYLGVPKATIYAWTFAKKIPFIKLGKALRFNRSEIDKWLETKKINASPPAQ